MRIAVLGTGTVGKTLGRKLVGLGHHVVMGSRRADNPSAIEWASSVGEGAANGTFADAAAAAELVINATAGGASLAALTAAGADNLSGKVLVDVANALDSSAGFPPSLSVVNTDSLAEAIQREFPLARVVKSLNTMRADVMVDPGRLAGGDHEVFVAGNDGDAKAVVSRLLQDFGWQPEHIWDLGGLDAARGLEMWLPLWLRLYMQQGDKIFNIKVVSD